MRTRVTTCPVCGRDVGLINDYRGPGSLPRPYRVSRHAAVDRDPSGRGRRPICGGSGLDVPADTIRDVAVRPSKRARARS